VISHVTDTLLPVRNSSIPNKIIGIKLLFYILESKIVDFFYFSALFYFISQT